MEATKRRTGIQLDSPWMTVKEAMAYLKVSRPTLYRWMTEGKLPFYNLGGTGVRRLKREDLDSLAEPGQASTSTNKAPDSL